MTFDLRRSTFDVSFEHAALLCLVLASRAALSQSIHTVAGGGIDDGKPATSAAIEPVSLALDGAGNLYVADLRDARVRKVSAATGLVETVAGNGTPSYSGDGGPATSAGMSPRGIAVDASGNLFIADVESEPGLPDATNRVRRVDAKTGIVTTIAGNGSRAFFGDGGPATLAGISPYAVTLDRVGNLYIADRANRRIRKISASTGIINTVAGGGTGGDGVGATMAELGTPSGVAVDALGDIFVVGDGPAIRKVDGKTTIISTLTGFFLLEPARPRGAAVDAAGNLFIADTDNQRVRRWNAVTGVVTTIAGTGMAAFSGDGGSAAEAALSSPTAVVVAAAGDVLIADTGNARVRRVNASGTITTVAGNGASGASGDGGPAIAARVSAAAVAVDARGDLYIAGASRVRKVEGGTGRIATVASGFAAASGVALDGAGNLFVADTLDARVRRVDRATGLVTTAAGDGTAAFSGDGGPAAQARLDAPKGIALDGDGNLFIADSGNRRVRRVDGRTGAISTVAGNGTASFSGDGGPATAAGLDGPIDVALDAAGNLFVAEREGRRVRRVDAASGVISTVAGNGSGGGSGDGGPAILAGLDLVSGIAVTRGGDLYIASPIDRVRKVDVASGIITTVAGTGVAGSSGDDGPALDAELTNPGGLAVDGSGALFIADAGLRVRAIFACVSVAPPVLTSPADGGSGGDAPVLAWSAVPGASRYDVLLDAANPPGRIVLSDATSTSFAPSSLEAGRTYFWRIVAKGDSFCVPPSSSASAVRSFTVPEGCGSPAAFTLLSPADGAAETGGTVTLTWEAAAGAGTYDLYLGASNPPPLLTRESRETSATLSGLVPGTTYAWLVVSHALCDPARTRATPLRSFNVGGECREAGPVAILSPTDGAASVTSPAALSWTRAENASSYDLYFGTSNPPPLVFPDLVQPSAIVSLEAGLTYYWRVEAKASCAGGKRTSTPVASFMATGTCGALAAPAFTFVPGGDVGAGSTYGVAWKAVPGASRYVVERALDESFSPLLDQQVTATPFASFVSIASTAPGRYRHRVRGISACDPTRRGPYGETGTVNLTAGPPNVVVTRPPRSVVDAQSTTFAVENIGVSPVNVVLGTSEIASRPFFRIFDPDGGDARSFTLAPRVPKLLEIRFSGPPADRRASYQGIVFATGAESPLATTPYAYVNLVVGEGGGASPRFARAGALVDRVSFPAFGGDDAARPPITVDVVNDGDAPMTLGAEIAPEAWLEPEAGWNAEAIPPHASRGIKLFTRRNRAPAGSALPRSTYFTVRTSSGEAERLLVEDVGAAAVTSGRGPALDADVLSTIVPSVVHATSAIGNTFVSKLRLSNVGTAAVQAELVFTPAEADGFDAGAVKRATVVVPPNDVVVLTDPLVALFGLSPPVAGALEVRAAPERIGALVASSTVEAAAEGGGSFGFAMPTISRGDGARVGRGLVIPGVTSTTSFRTNLILAETTGRDAAAVRITLVDATGQRRGDTLVTVPRYGQVQVSGVAVKLGGGDGFRAGRLELAVESGGGAVVGVITVVDNATDDAVTIVGSKVNAETGPRRLVLPAAVNGFSTFPGTELPFTFRSLMGFTGPATSTATFRLTFQDLQNAKIVERTVTIGPRQTVEYANVLEELFGVPATAKAQGPIFIDADAGGIVYAKVGSDLSRGTLGDSFPVVPVPSDALTGAGLSTPLFADGLEQSGDPSRGTRSNLILNEVTGAPVTLLVRLYEAGNRTSPIAEQEITLAAFEKKQLSTLFAGLGLDREDRRKDRVSVLCVVVARSGAGLASTVITTIDARTGDTKNVLLTPAGATTF